MALWKQEGSWEENRKVQEVTWNQEALKSNQHIDLITWMDSRGLLSHLMSYYFVIGLITVFDAILTGRQSGQKLQCLYGNPIANNFFQN